MFKVFLLSGLLSICWNSSATPMHAIRKGSAILLGTNQMQSLGTRVCKFHFAKNGVVMRAVHAAEIKNVTGEIYADFDKDLDRDLRGRQLSTSELRAAAIASSERTVRDMSLIVPDTPEQNSHFTSYFFVAGMENGVRSIDAFSLTVVNRKDSGNFKVETMKTPFDKGNFLYFVAGIWKEWPYPQSIDPESILRQSLAMEAQHRQEEGITGFEPPFSILQIESNGHMTVLDDAQSPCLKSFAQRSVIEAG